MVIGLQQIPPTYTCTHINAQLPLPVMWFITASAGQKQRDKNALWYIQITGMMEETCYGKGRLFWMTPIKHRWNRLNTLQSLHFGYILKEADCFLSFLIPLQWWMLIFNMVRAWNNEIGACIIKLRVKSELHTDRNSFWWFFTLCMLWEEVSLILLT